MDTEAFNVQNVTCNGCVATIREGLRELPGVSQVEVAVDSGEVLVRGEDLERDMLAAKLAALGYPEA